MPDQEKIVGYEIIAVEGPLKEVAPRIKQLLDANYGLLSHGCYPGSQTETIGVFVGLFAKNHTPQPSGMRPLTEQEKKAYGETKK